MGVPAGEARLRVGGPTQRVAPGLLGESGLRVGWTAGSLPQYDVVHEGRWLGRVDLAWPEARLIVEYEGAYHFEGLQIARDDVRLERLVAAGWRVLRVAAHDLHDMEALVARIAEALRSGARGGLLL